MTDRPLTVLMSFPPPLPTSNPYNSLLMDSVAALPNTKVLTFSWRRALFGKYDLFHVHWPEILVTGHSWWKQLVRQALFVVLLIRLRLLRRPLVRTFHNLELPQGISPLQTALLRWAERWTTFWIVINTTTELPANRPHAVALHGHYRDWYSRYPSLEATPGRFGFFGGVRRYKNAVGLVRALRQCDDPALSLRICGRPSSQALADELRDAAGDDPRIELVLQFIDDPALVAHATSSELVVLPYPEMHNSGSVFAALSLDRPVLVPDNEVNRRLATEVGQQWVIRYQGELSSAHLLSALAAVREIPAGSRPDLSQRDWPLIAGQHLAAYLKALALAHRAAAGPDAAADV